MSSRLIGSDAEVDIGTEPVKKRALSASVDRAKPSDRPKYISRSVVILISKGVASEHLARVEHLMYDDFRQQLTDLSPISASRLECPPGCRAMLLYHSSRKRMSAFVSICHTEKFLVNPTLRSLSWTRILGKLFTVEGDSTVEYYSLGSRLDSLYKSSSLIVKVNLLEYM